MAQVIRSGQRAGSSTVTAEREDGSIVIEADAAEDAVAFARERFGADVEIIEVNRLERGGLKGFFAREYYSVIAGPPRRIRAPEPPRTRAPVGARPEVDALVRQIGRMGSSSTAGAALRPTSEPEAATASPREEPADGIGRALGKVEPEEEAFGSMLRRELHARGLTPSSPETIDLTDRRPGSEDAPVPVGPAVARPLRPGSSPTPVPPAPVPPKERFRLDEPAPPAAAPSTPRPATPLPVRTEAAAVAARTTLQDAVVVESQALVRPAPVRTPTTTPAEPRRVASQPVPTPAEPVAPDAGTDEGTAHPVEGERSGPGAETDDVSVEGERSRPAAEAAVVAPDEAERSEPGADEAVVVAPVEAEPLESADEAVVTPDEAERSGSTSATVAVRTQEPPRPDTPPGLGSVRWSVDRLAHLGLPFALVQRTVGLDPADDQRWLLTLAAGLADFVRPEPAGSAVFAGPRADRIGAAMDLPVVEAPELPPYGGSVALKTTDDGAGRAWLARVRGDRVLHVVVGGRGWELLLAKEPDAVVVSSADSVLSGLQVAVEHGVPISYVSDAEGLRRADALDLAIAVRSLVGRW